MIHGSRNSQTVMDKSFYLNIQKKRWAGMKRNSYSELVSSNHLQNIPS